MQKRVSIIIPTVTGREQDYNRLYDALDFPRDMRIHEVIIVKDRDTCGEAWQLGVNNAMGEYVVCLADDLCPIGTKWIDRAIEAWDIGWCPVPKIWTMPSGEIESAGVWRQHFPHGTEVPTTTIPFCKTDFWQGKYVMPNMHYATDNLFADWCKSEGRIPRVVEGFNFTHWWSPVKRKPHPNDFSAEKR